MMLKSIFRKSVIMASLALLFIISSNGQTADTSRRDAIRVFIDCQSCDMNYIREEMPYVNYVREVREAQVYLQVARQMSGSGGGVYTLFFDGQENFSGMKDTLVFNASPDNTTTVTREGLTKTISAGLMRYVAKTPILSQVQISYQGQRMEAPEQVEDNWDYWVFELTTMPRFSLEKSVESLTWTNGIEANRVTPEWKIENSFDHSYSKTTYIRDIRDSVGTVIGESRDDVIRKSWGLDQLTVRSISNHFSVGLRANAGMSTTNNYDLNIGISPAIEYNLFPYSESTRRQLRVLYGIGYNYADYIDTTVYNKTEESLWEHSIDIALQVQQAWGSANVSLGASNYLHDFSKYQVELDGFLRIRLLKGLSLNVNGSVAFIHNQLNLAMGEISDQQLYLRLRTLETNYRYEGSVGLTYTFGSIYSNVVNPRFGGGGGFGGGQGGGSGFGGGR